MNKLISGIIAIGIYLSLIFIILLYYNVHEQKSRNYVDKNSNRVTVTLVNSDKTVFNRSSKHSTPTRPLKVHHSIKHNNSHITPPKPKIVQRHIRPKKVHATPTRKEIEAKKIADRAKRREAKAKREARLARIAKERKRRAEARARAERIKQERNRREEARAEQIRQEREKKRLARIRAEEIKRAKAKKEAQRLARIKQERKRREEARAEQIRQERERKRLARIRAEEIKRAKAKKEAERLARIEEERKRREEARAEEIRQEREKKRLARIRAQRERENRIKEQSRNLFSSVNIHTPKKSPHTVSDEPTEVRHNSNIADRIKNTHLSGIKSNRNRDRGVENAYIAKVKNQLNNWSAQSIYKGHQATIILTIMNSGKFRYTIKRSTSGALNDGLREFLDQLIRIGLGQHNKSTPYRISVIFRAR